MDGYPPVVSRVAAALKELRTRELKLTQAAFAELAGISPAQVSTYENGREMPSKVVLDRIAARVGRPTEALDPEGEAYAASAPRRRLRDGEPQPHTPGNARKEVTVEDPRRYEFVSLFDSLVRNPTAQEELVTMVRRFVARKLGNG